MMNRVLILSCFTLLLFTVQSTHAKDVSLEKLKQMIDASAHLSEPAATKPSNASDTKNKTEITGQGATSGYVVIDELKALPESRRVLLDVRSNHSDGAHDMDMLAGLAKKRGIDTLVFGEHDRYTIKFGLDPIPQLLGVSQEHPSLYETGLDEFFTDLNRVQNRHPDLHVMAATESTPGYSWSGIPFKDLTLNEAEKHLIALGIENADQVKALPSYDLRNIQGNFELSLAIWFFAIFLLLIVLMRKRKRSVALLLLASFIAFLSTWLLQKKVDPDVDFIDTAREQGLFVIWTHPGTLSGVRDGPLGIKLNTPPYNRRVFEEPTADAFAAVYGDSDDNSLPGGMWDRFMMDYMFGYRPNPIWAVSAGDYHAEGQANEYLGNFPMDVWTEGSDSKAVMEALRKGRNSSWSMPKNLNLRLSALYLEDEAGKRLLPGGDSSVTQKVKLYAGISEWMPEGESREALASEQLTLRGEWIVDGRVVANITLPVDNSVSATPLELTPGPHVVRLRIPAQKSVRMEANPFLLRVKR
ncbi:MAG: hypothetical protein ABUK11_06910 [Mariprofundaceae bacterium]